MDLGAVDLNLGGDRPARESEHERSRQRPRLGVDVGHLPDLDSGLFTNLATYGVCQALARFDEAGQRRPATCRPGGLASQQRTIVLIGDEHDHRGVRARELIALTLTTAQHMAGLARLETATAARAVTMCEMPFGKPDGLHEERELLGANQSERFAQAHPHRARLTREFAATQKRETGSLGTDSQENPRPLGRLLDRDPSHRALAHLELGASEDQDTSGRIRPHLINPEFVVTMWSVPVKGINGGLAHTPDGIARSYPILMAPMKCSNVMWKSTVTALRTPAWIARIVGFVGLLTLVDAAVPAMHERLHEISEIVPEAFPAAATTGALGIGVILMLLSRALRRGKFRAWVLATVLTALTVVLHLVKGFDFEEAVISALLLILLLSARREFTARPDPRSAALVIETAIFGPLVATFLGWLWLTIDARGEVAGTTIGDRVVHAFVGLVGVTGPVRFDSQVHADRAAIALVVLGACVLGLLLLAAMMPAGGPHHLRDREERQVREILDRWGHVDSLSYFATRRDRAVLFSKSGKAAVSYRVVGTVSLAAGDPLGDPEAWTGAIEAWLDEARSYGWVPAVLGASETGATAYHRAGLDVIELGDEAIVRVDEFSLEGRSMRVVRQADARCKRAGLSTACKRVRDLTEDERTLIRQKADAWRDGQVERGFSMALGRFVEPEDGDSVVVLCRDEAGELRGLLNLVPWGADCLSLDLMRRDREAENGIVEHMVVALWEACPALGVARFSLNFAVFRSVFARGERLGAGPVLRLWRSILMAASRYWQIESLYRANAKYQPDWEPRFLAYRSAGDLPRVGTAALRAEAFLVAPTWLQRISRG